MQRIPQLLFQKQAEVEAKQIELLKQLALPKWEHWKVDWKKLEEIGKSNHKKRWNQLHVYNTLVKYKTKPAIYCMFVEQGLGLSLFRKFKEAKEFHSLTRRKSGVPVQGYRNLSYLNKTYNGSDCIYVGSRRENLHDRFKQHLGYGSGRTGALHLAKLFNKSERPPPVIFYYIILDEKYRLITEKIEAVVQKKLKPFIGKGILGD